MFFQLLFLIEILFLDMLGSGLVSNNAVAAPTNRDKDFEVTQPPDDSVSALVFSPAALQQNFLIAGSWDNSVSTKFQKHIIYYNTYLRF